MPTLWMTLREYREKLTGTFDEAHLTEAAEFAQEVVRVYTGKTFSVGVSETITVDGTGTAWLPLPFGMRPATITAIHVNGDSIDLVNSDGDDLLHVHADSGLLIYGSGHFEDGCVDECGCDISGIFAKGVNNVEISGTFGDASEPPAPVKLALKMLVQRFLEEELVFNAYESEGMPGDWTSTARKAVENVTVHGSTGWGDIDAMLNLYRRRTPTIAVV